MIRYYTYYSCGGYKDLFIGSDEDNVDASFFIPLINVWKKTNKSENAEKIKRAENVKQVEIITQNESVGFPPECNLMFSHGGYIAIYRTLVDGRTCFCIRDISNGLEDEEGRSIPFNFLFLADGQESITKLDGLALKYCEGQEKIITNLIAQSIYYDHIINGVKFDLEKLKQLFPNHPYEGSTLNHKRGVVDFIIIGNRQQYALALNEQKIADNQVTASFDQSGRRIYGAIDRRMDSNGSERKDDSLSDDTIEENESKSVDNERLDNLDSSSDNKSNQVYDNTKTDSETPDSTLDKLSTDGPQRTDNIRNAGSPPDNLPTVPLNRICLRNLLRDKNFIIAIIGLIVGFVLGALIF